MSSSERIRKQSESAAALGVTPKTLRAWELTAWWRPHFRTKDGWDIDAIRAANPSEQDKDVRTAHADDMRSMARREQEARLKMVEMRAAKEAGKLVDLEKVSEVFRLADEQFVAVILDIPVRVARLLPDGKLRNEVLVEADLICRNALRAHADNLKASFERFATNQKANLK